MKYDNSIQHLTLNIWMQNSELKDYSMIKFMSSTKFSEFPKQDSFPELMRNQ